MISKGDRLPPTDLSESKTFKDLKNRRRHRSKNLDRKIDENQVRRDIFLPLKGKDQKRKRGNLDVQRTFKEGRYRGWTEVSRTGKTWCITGRYFVGVLSRSLLIVKNKVVIWKICKLRHLSTERQFHRRVLLFCISIP